jgi:hypothetical protein
MIVRQWFHHSTSMLGWFDWARTGGCSHLPIVAEEYMGLYPPSGCSWKKKEVGASNECNS